MSVCVCCLLHTCMCKCVACLVFRCLCYQSSLVFTSCTMQDQQHRVGQVHKGQGLKSLKECSMYVFTCAQLKLFIMFEKGTLINHAVIHC